MLFSVINYFAAALTYKTYSLLYLLKKEREFFRKRSQPSAR